MRHRLLAALCCFLMLPVLSGCRYSHEISEMAYTVALGLDKGENGAIRVTFQFAKPTMLAGEDSGGGDSAEDGEADGTAKDASTALVTVDSVDIYSALSVVGNILSKQINLSHTKLLLFSAELAQDGIMDYITMLMKNSQFSPKTFVAVSLCSAQEYLKTVNPSLESNPAKYYTLVFSKDNSAYIPTVTLRDLYFNITALGQEPVVPAAGLTLESADALEEEEQKQAVLGNFVAGRLPKTGENKTEISGMCVIKNGKFETALTSQEVMLYNLLQGHAKETYFNLPSETAEGKHITLRLDQKKKPIQRVVIEENIPHIEVTLPLDAEIVKCPPGDYDKQKIDGLNQVAAQELERSVKAFLEDSSRGYGADIIGYGRRAKKLFQSYADWERYNWPTRFPDSEFTVHVTVNITEEGLIHNE